VVCRRSATELRHNGRQRVPSILLNPVFPPPVTKDNIKTTVVADGFGPRSDLYSPTRVHTSKRHHRPVHTTGMSTRDGRVPLLNVAGISKHFGSSPRRSPT